MTEDQVKAIAEEYLEGVYPKNWKELSPYSSKVEIEKLSEFIRWFNDKYCIVEREKVIDYYKQSHTECFMPTTCLDREFARGKCRVMEDLFGTSMFNQNKE